MSETNEDSYEENGRLYHSFRRGTYLCPCDDLEKNRLDIYHSMIKRARRRIDFPGHCTAGQPELHLVNLPWKEASPRILDLGCGTGIWVLEMARAYASRIEVVGIDLVNMTPINSGNQPAAKDKWSFQFNKDFEYEWSSEGDYWDFIHIGNLCGSVRDWSSLYRTILHQLKPGQASLEQVEIDLRPRYEDPAYQNDPDFPLNRWYELLTKATKAAGRSIEYNLNTPDLLRSMGFVDVQEHIVPLALHFDADWPPNPADKDIAKWYCSCLGVHPNERDSALEALSLAAFTRFLNWTFEEWKAFEKQIWDSIKYSDIRVCHTLHIITARKPSIYEINRPTPRRGL